MTADDGSDSPVLGSVRRLPIDHVEWFEAPSGCVSVRFSTDEVISLCPVTGQPDFNTVTIEYKPHRRCIESKSLKLYLWSFRNRAVFAESLAVEIANEVKTTIEPNLVRVVVHQHVRGGITTEAVAEL
jgi:7-cyano-7-deazaguanine reductase